MDRLRDRFDMTELTLSVSFRCPEEIVAHARRYAPHMQAFKAGGEVRRLAEWSASDIPDGAAIICRNNAPLFKLGMALLRRGRGVRLVGTDLGPNLVKQLRKLGPLDTPRTELLNLINVWEENKLATSKSPGSIEDRANCFRVFAGFGATLGEAATYAEFLFKSGGTIDLLSGHKAKGLEWDSVFHLDSWRIPSRWASSESELAQERNLDYVIMTRAKQTLTYIDMVGFTDGQ